MNYRRRYKLLVLIALIAAPILFVAYDVLRRPKHIDIIGEVVSAATGQPISDARVIVTLWDWHLDPMVDCSPHQFATRTDERGTFTFSKSADYRISRVEVEAVAPDNAYGHLESARATDVQWTVAVSKEGAPREARFGYQEFRGLWGTPDDRRLVFLGPRW